MTTSGSVRILLGCVAAGCVLSAGAWTVDANGKASIASGETKVVSSTDDFVHEGRPISYIDVGAGGILEFADGFESTDWLEFGGSGKIHFSGDVVFNTYYVSAGSPQGFTYNGATLTFDGPFSCANGNGWFQIRDNDGKGGTVFINANGNKFAQFRFTSNIGVKLGATDALFSFADSGVGGLDFNGATYDGPGLDLNGYSTRVKALNANDLQPSEGNDSFALVKSAKPATLQVNGLMADGYNFPFKFTDKASFLYNGSGQTLNLVNIVSTSSGDLGVANGTLVMKWNAGWGGETVTVTGGVFQVDSPKAFANKAVCFTVVAPGRVVLNQDVYVDRLFVDGQEIPAGKKYTTEELGSQFSGGGSISVRYEQKDPVFDTYVWTGADGQSVSAPGVWKDGKTADLSDGGATLVFSKGGVSATVTEDISVYAIRFLSSFPFALSSASDATITLSDGVTADAASAPTVTSTVSANLLMTAANTAPWTIGANAALRVDGNVASKGGSTLNIAGDGALYLNGDNSGLTRQLSLGNALVVAGSPTALGSSANTAVVSENTLLRFDCLTNDVPLQITGSVNGKNRPNLAGLGTLVQNGSVKIPSVSYFDISGLRLRGGVGGSGSGGVNFYIFGNKEAWIENMPLAVEGGVGTRFTASGTLHLAVAGNTYPQSFGVRNYGDDTARLICDADNVFDSSRLFTFGTAGEGQNGILDLNGHDQQMLAFATYAYGYTEVTQKGASCGVVTSAVPAKVTISGRPYYTYAANCNYFGRSATGYFSPTNSVAFRGQSSLVFAATGSEETCFVNGKSDTTGSLTVNSGRLVFDWGAGWTATTNVTINGGVLRIAKESESCAFGPAAGRSKAILRISGDGRLELDDTVVTTVKALSVADGEFVKAGTYGGPEAGLDAAHTLSQLAGRGRLAVRTSGPGGLMLIFR